MKQHVAHDGKNATKCPKSTDEAKDKCQKSIDGAKRRGQRRWFVS